MLIKNRMTVLKSISYVGAVMSYAGCGCSYNAGLDCTAHYMYIVVLIIYWKGCTAWKLHIRKIRSSCNGFFLCHGDRLLKG